MDRDLKFRAKVEPQGDEPPFPGWVYGGGVQMLPNGKCALLGLDSEGRILITLVIPESVGQYTGYKDKNGVEVYEWDIIESMPVRKNTKNKTVSNDGFKFVVVWEEIPDYESGDEIAVGFHVCGEMFDGTLERQVGFTSYAVIGNKYEHPTLH